MRTDPCSAPLSPSLWQPYCLHVTGHRWPTIKFYLLLNYNLLYIINHTIQCQLQLGNANPGLWVTWPFWNLKTWVYPRFETQVWGVRKPSVSPPFSRFSSQRSMQVQQNALHHGTQCIMYNCTSHIDHHNLVRITIALIWVTYLLIGSRHLFVGDVI